MSGTCRKRSMVLNGGLGSSRMSTSTKLLFNYPQLAIAQIQTMKFFKAELLDITAMSISMIPGGKHLL